MTGNTQKSSGQGPWGWESAPLPQDPGRPQPARSWSPYHPTPPPQDGVGGGAWPRAPLVGTRALWKPLHLPQNTGAFRQLWAFPAVRPAVWWPASGPGPPALMAELRHVYLFLCPRATPPAACTPAEGRSRLSSILSDLDVAFRQGWVCLLRMGFFRTIYEQKKTLK